jgi:hypothetical protein
MWFGTSGGKDALFFMKYCEQSHPLRGSPGGLVAPSPGKLPVCKYDTLLKPPRERPRGVRVVPQNRENEKNHQVLRAGGRSSQPGVWGNQPPSLIIFFHSPKFFPIVKIFHARKFFYRKLFPEFFSDFFIRQFSPEKSFQEISRLSRTARDSQKSCVVPVFDILKSFEFPHCRAHCADSVVVITRRCQRLNPGSSPGRRILP